MRDFIVHAHGMRSWQPVEATDLSNDSLRWDGRWYDLSNVADLAALAVDLELDDGVADTLAELQSVTEAADAESARLRAQIQADDVKAQAFAAANKAMGIDAANRAMEDRLSGAARVADIERFRENYGDAAQRASTRRPSARPDARPAQSTPEGSRAERIREHRRNAGI